MSLYYIDKDLSIEYFDREYTLKSEWVGYVDENEEMYLSRVFFETPVEDKNEKDFKVYVVDSECDDSSYCNHGELLALAVNSNTKEVIYYHGDW